jgi:hypothetical protein
MGAEERFVLGLRRRRLGTRVQVSTSVIGVVCGAGIGTLRGGAGTLRGGTAGGAGGAATEGAATGGRVGTGGAVAGGAAT